MFSVVIPSKNGGNTMACLESIVENEPGLDARNIIVVDDSPSIDVEYACNSFGATCIKGEKPFIYARNSNIGLRRAFESGSTAAILLNDDTLLKTHRGFTSLALAAQDNPQYGLLASSTNTVGNQNQLPHGSDVIRDEPRMVCFICVLIPRATWEKVGPLDEDFTGYGFDDNAYCESVKSADLKIGIWDGCFVDHSVLKSTFRGDSYPTEGFDHNRMIFERKWGRSA